MGAGHVCDRGPQISAPADSAVRTHHSNHPRRTLVQVSSAWHICTACRAPLLILQLLLRETTSPTPLARAPLSPDASFSDPGFRGPQEQRRAIMRMPRACALSTYALTCQLHQLTLELRHCTACSRVCACTQTPRYTVAHNPHTCTSTGHTVHLNQ